MGTWKRKKTKCSKINGLLENALSKFLVYGQNIFILIWIAFSKYLNDINSIESPDVTVSSAEILWIAFNVQNVFIDVIHI